MYDCEYLEKIPKGTFINVHTHLFQGSLGRFI